MAGKKLREKSGATVLNRQASLNFPTDKNKVASAGIERTKRNIIIDYSRFRFPAVVDWVEIASSTERHTNFQTGAEKTTGHSWLPEGKDSYVQALEKGAGGRATVFRFRIYDPKNWQQVMSIARKLCEYFHDARELLAQGIDRARIVRLRRRPNRIGRRTASKW